MIQKLNQASFDRGLSWTSASDQPIDNSPPLGIVPMSFHFPEKSGFCIDPSAWYVLLRQVSTQCLEAATGGNIAEAKANRSL
jgi:hypothetical protein